MVFQLNDGWIFRLDYKEEYIEDSSLIKGSIVRIPHTFKLVDFNYFDENSYQKIGTYYKKICLSKQYAGKCIFIHFEAVMSEAKIYLNGKYVGSHQGGYLGFDIDLTNVIEFEKDNDLVVVVDSRELEEIPPFGDVIDYLTYSGIYREITLNIVNKEHVKSIKISPIDLNSLKVEIDSTIQKNSKYEISLIDNDSNILDVENFQYNQESYLLNRFKAKYWELNNPILYKLKVTIISVKGEIIDTKIERFGFRFVEITKEGFFLNYRKIKPYGLNRHQSYPFVGYAATQSLQELDADILKNDLCTDLVRTSHYPNSRHFLNRCDEIGLLVITEIPGWQYISKNEVWRSNCEMNVKDMILEDFNHPSIVMWGVRINESPDDDELYKKTNEIAHSLDDTRPTGGVRNFRESKLMEDVFTYNDFVCDGGKQGLLSPLNFPYVVTEHNGHMHPTKIDDPESSRVSQALRHLIVLNDFMKYPGIAALTGWCMSDYNTHKEFGAGDRICYHGILDMFRNKKYAARVYESQSDDHIVLFPMHYFEPGDYDAMNVPFFYILTNCDSVKLFINGVFIETYYPDKEGFPYLKHPPIKINGFLSNLDEYKGIYSKKDICKLKLYFKEIHQYNDVKKLNLKTKIGLLIFMKKYGLTQAELTKIYTKHNNLWIDSHMKFEFVGIMSGVEAIKKEAIRRIFDHINIQASKYELIEGNTYDMAEVTLNCVDSVGNELPYFKKAFKLSCDSALEIIGPKYIPAVGGTASFYIRTTGASGEAKVLVESDNVKKVIVFTIRKEEVLKI